LGLDEDNMTREDDIHKLNYEFGALVRKSPKSQVEMQEMNRLGDALRTALRMETKPVLDDLATVGIFADIWDLVNTSTSYRAAIPILVQHLGKPYHHKNKEGILRALAVKDARGIANKAVIEEYRKAPKEDPKQPWIFHYRWAFGNTMRVIVTKDDLDELIEIVLDESNGDSREMFVRALAKLKSQKIRVILNKLSDDKSKLVAVEAQKALVRKKPAK
jgi:hypothetical protein